MSTREFGAVVEFEAPVDSVFDYLSDPRNRPEWQSSLLSVSLAERADPYVGMRWRETTVVGVRPRMEITDLEPCQRWSEHGWWQGISADLTLRFSAIPATTQNTGGCRVRAEGRIHGSGLWRVPAVVAGRLGSVAIGADLRRAARIVADRQTP